MPTTNGIHHITMICRDMEETTCFYTELLDMRLVKQTVNFDDPSSKHFYFGDEAGSPGTVLTFFENPEGRPAQASPTRWSSVGWWSRPSGEGM